MWRDGPIRGIDVLFVWVSVFSGQSSLISISLSFDRNMMY